jgi:hypothetical protein
MNYLSTKKRIEEAFEESKEKWDKEFESLSISDSEEKLMELIENKAKILLSWERKLSELRILKFHAESYLNKEYAKLYNKYLLGEIKYSAREIDKMIKGDNQYIEKAALAEKAEIMIKKLENFIGFIKNIHWDIKNMIDIKKLIYGIST